MSAKSKIEMPKGFVRPKDSIPGLRRVEPAHVIEKAKADLQSRMDEHRLVGRSEERHGYLRDDAGKSKIENATIRRQERMIKRNSPRLLDKKERMEWERQAKEFEEWLVKHMLPRSLTSLKPRDIQFKRMASRMAETEMSSQFAQVADRWKNIMRTLHPDDPSMSSIERIRPS